MNGERSKIVIAVGGASGSIYTRLLIESLKKFGGDREITMVWSDNAKINWRLEFGEWSEDNFPFKIYGKNDFNAPFASGSAGYDALVICPSSMGVIGRIASGISNDLVTRAADVMLKERKRLILIPRENPFNLIHLRNMTTITEAGGIICPAIPSFYSNPQSVDEVAQTVVDRVLSLLDVDTKGFKWGS